LLKTPDILLANDSRLLAIYRLINIGKVTAFRCPRQFGLRWRYAQFSPTDGPLPEYPASM
jgi:hypothetical protein